MTPLALEMLLWFGTNADEFPGFVNDAPQRELVTMMQESICAPGPNGVTLLPRGRAWLDMLLSTPMPVQQWIDPRGLAIASGEARTAAPVLAKVQKPSTPASDAPTGEYKMTESRLDPGGPDAAGLYRDAGNVFAPSPQIPVGMSPWSGKTPAKPPELMPGDFLNTLRRNGTMDQKYTGSVNWKDRGKKDDVVAYQIIPEPEGAHKAHVGTSAKAAPA